MSISEQKQLMNLCKDLDDDLTELMEYSVKRNLMDIRLQLAITDKEDLKTIHKLETDIDHFDCALRNIYERISRLREYHKQLSLADESNPNAYSKTIADVKRGIEKIKEHYFPALSRRAEQAPVATFTGQSKEVLNTLESILNKLKKDCEKFVASADTKRKKSVNAFLVKITACHADCNNIKTTTHKNVDAKAVSDLFQKINQVIEKERGNLKGAAFSPHYAKLIDSAQSEIKTLQEIEKPNMRMK